MGDLATLFDHTDLRKLHFKIEIVQGPFKGLKAVFSHTDGIQRSIVLINLLNQQTPTSLSNTQIKKLAKII